MPPQNTQPPPPGQFDFILNDQAKPPGRLGVLLSGIPRTAKIILLVVGILFIIVILYGLFFGGKTTNTEQIYAVMARAQEISRVSTLVQQQGQNSDTKDLAATTTIVLSSQEQELRSYLKSNRVKVSTKKLASRLDKSTDAQLATAQQNNNYDQTYFSYLKTNLATYQNDLLSAREGASKKAQTLLGTDYNSIQTLLTAPQLK